MDTQMDAQTQANGQSRFEYEILVPKRDARTPAGVVWFRAADTMAAEALGGDLSAVLNRLGSEGWEVAGVGDLGFDSRSEIILKRRAMS